MIGTVGTGIFGEELTESTSDTLRDQRDARAEKVLRTPKVEEEEEEGEGEAAGGTLGVCAGTGG